MKAGKMYADEELIQAIQDKKSTDDAILYIYQQYSDYISSFIMNYGGSRQDGEDVFQETVVAFVDIVNRGRFRGEASIKTFLASIAKNTWFNALKKRERSAAREKLYETSKEENEMDVSHYISEREMKQQLRELLYKLDEPCRKILLLFYYENLSMKEMVDHLPYENEQVVRNKKYKCLQQLTSYVKNDPLAAAKIKSV
ncbi:MAG TPA: RNA polymerase sigma factor [Puia sp.]|nr:RNA polymerase sigma factor [Puia sp.]